ncbi:MAG: hypothetical protein AB7V13_29535 [Pseudorhodoplanes sp.]|uniref:hypothetical protein n=1 Tax=Pseudorhodoplanes sp. TaxID=1934341 RepID=UPI003D0AD39F
MAKYVAVCTETDGSLQIEEFKAPSDDKARKLARKLGAEILISKRRALPMRSASSDTQRTPPRLNAAS